MAALLGVETFDLYGLTELWVPGAGIECAQHNGIHVWSDYYQVEIIDPQTLAPVPPSTMGEVVVTTLTKQASGRCKGWLAISAGPGLDQSSWNGATHRQERRSR